MENLIGVALGAVVAALAGLGGLIISKNNEHDQWRRNERVKVYSDFLAAINEQLPKIIPAGTRRAQVSFPHALMARIHVVGSKAVREAAQEYASQMLVLETTAAFLASDGEFLDVPGPDRRRHQDMHAQAHKQYHDLAAAFLHAVRKDLRTLDKGERPNIGT